MKKKLDITMNPFEDVGLVDSDIQLLKANLAIHINKVIQLQGLTQKQAAVVLDVDQPKVSALVNGKLYGFSIDRLVHFLRQLGYRIELDIVPFEQAKKTKPNVLSGKKKIQQRQI